MTNNFRKPEGLDRYFVSRPSPTGNQKEDTYWGPVVDPDGNNRNRLEERDRYLEDVKRELSFVNGLPLGSVLDVGCGPGFFLSGLRPGWKKYGVEISETAAAIAENWASIHKGTLETADFKAGQFDVIVLHHVIEHLPDPIATMRNIRRILRNGGHLIVGTPDFDSGCARRFGANYRLLQDTTHISLFTADSLYRLLRDLGFIIDKVDFPFFETRHFTTDNLLRLFDLTRVSPPFYGNFITCYCRKPRFLKTVRVYQRLGIVSPMELERLEQKIASALKLLKESQTLWIGEKRLEDWLTDWLAENRTFNDAPFNLIMRSLNCDLANLDNTDKKRRHLLLFAPDSLKSIYQILDDTRGGQWRTIGIVPEAYEGQQNKFDITLSVPTIDDVAPNALQVVIAQALILDLVDDQRL